MSRLFFSPYILFVLVFSTGVLACGDSEEQPSPVTVRQVKDDSPTTTGTTEIKAIRAFPHLDFDQPVFLTWLPGDADRLAVIEQSGRILVFDNSDDVEAADVFLDISGKVKSGGEEGLLGLAFDPDFDKNGLFYVYYSAADPRRTVLSRLYVDKDDPGKADPQSEQVLLEVEQPFANHKGGTITIGPDGYLYVALGDGGGGGDPFGNAQNLSELLGSILRINVSGGNGYRIPEDNPFVDHPVARGEIWAYGLRNPYRFSFDRKTGELWAGDVGQGAREEIDLIKKGDNYGWSYFEGNLEYDNPEGLPAGGFTAPVIDYDRSQGISVIGGYVYRGDDFPSLAGIYFYGDYGSGNVWALVYEEGAVVSNILEAQVPAISSFGEDRRGEVYIVSHDGQIFKIIEG